jgi:hypothetical protein
MAVEDDMSALLPKPPPPRPARREAAVEAAMRKFDGAEDAAPERPRRSWPAAHPPQMAALVTATLLVVIGIPAAFVGMRTPSSTSEHAPAVIAPKTECTGNCTQQAEPAPQPGFVANAEVAEVPGPAAEPRPAAPIRTRESADRAVAVNEKPIASAPPPVAAENAAPAAPVIAAAPPPPPPPPAVASAERVTGLAVAQDVVVTVMRASVRAPANEIERKTTEDRPYGAFLARLQAAVRSGDHRAVIALIDWPLRVNGSGGTRRYRDAQSLERDFDQVFTPRVRTAILKQRADRLFVRDQGAMIGTGEVWFSRTCPNAGCSPGGPVRITAVNR